MGVSVPDTRPCQNLVRVCSSLGKGVFSRFRSPKRNARTKFNFISCCTATPNQTWRNGKNCTKAIEHCQHVPDITCIAYLRTSCKVTCDHQPYDHPGNPQESKVPPQPAQGYRADLAAIGRPTSATATSSPAPPASVTALRQSLDNLALQAACPHLRSVASAPADGSS
jgi:hypothetical protein